MQLDVEIREAQPADREAVRTVARRSLQSSYSLSPGVIDAAVETWYANGGFDDRRERPEVTILMAEAGDEAVGFTESVLTDDGDGDVHWLHVAPAHRGAGIGSRLFEQTKTELEAAGADRLRGKVLAMNAEGNSFYERRGLEKVTTDTVRIDGTAYVENVYAKTATPGLRVVTAPDGRELYVDPDAADSGSEAAFQHVYTASNGESRFGYFCANCESLANAMDTMGRIQCPECENVRGPSRWDAAYL